MQFSGRRKKLIGSSQNELYDHCLQFYGQPPLDNISLTEFETFAVERLKCESSACDVFLNENYFNIILIYFYN